MRQCLTFALQCYNTQLNSQNHLPKVVTPGVAYKGTNYLFKEFFEVKNSWCQDKMITQTLWIAKHHDSIEIITEFYCKRFIEVVKIKINNKFGKLQ